MNDAGHAGDESEDESMAASRIDSEGPGEFTAEPAAEPVADQFGVVSFLRDMPWDTVEGVAYDAASQSLVMTNGKQVWQLMLTRDGEVPARARFIILADTNDLNRDIDPAHTRPPTRSSTNAWRRSDYRSGSSSHHISGIACGNDGTIFIHSGTRVHALQPTHRPGKYLIVLAATAPKYSHDMVKCPRTNQLFMVRTNYKRDGVENVSWDELHAVAIQEPSGTPSSSSSSSSSTTTSNTLVAGSKLSTFQDGPGATAAFGNSFGTTWMFPWHTNRDGQRCGVHGLVMNSAGNVIIMDRINGAVRCYSHGAVTTIARRQEGRNNWLNPTVGTIVKGGGSTHDQLYVADSGEIRRITLALALTFPVQDLVLVHTPHAEESFDAITRTKTTTESTADIFGRYALALVQVSPSRLIQVSGGRMFAIDLHGGPASWARRREPILAWAAWREELRAVAAARDAHWRGT